MLLKKLLNQWWVWIFEYSNKMTLKYYSYLYLCYFRNTNIFGYLFGKYVASEYIQVFIWYIMWHPNIFGYSFVSILWYSLITVVFSASKSFFWAMRHCKHPQRSQSHNAELIFAPWLETTPGLGLVPNRR